MKRNNIFLFFIIILVINFLGCDTKPREVEDLPKVEMVADLAIVQLKQDLSSLQVSEQKMIKLFIESAQYVDSIFFYQNIGYFKEQFTHFPDSLSEQMFNINFGPWNRTDGDKPFLADVSDKPLGANFYPTDITKEDFEKLDDANKLSSFTFIRRNSKSELTVVPYHVELKNYITNITSRLREAAELSTNQEFKKYLLTNSQALESDEYHLSDSTWLGLKDNFIEIILGPLDIYEDKFYNCKADYLSYVLLKNEEWTKKMAKYTTWLPFLQKALPVSEEYRSEEPLKNIDIFVYDAIYVAGSARAGGVTIAMNLPLNHKNQKVVGKRNLQFKNIIEAKFDAILLPISKIIYESEDNHNINSETFFTNVILFEMAKSLGINQTINDKGKVRDALKDTYTVIDILKGTVLTLFLVEKMNEVGEIHNDIKDNYQTLIANIVRIIRLGGSSDYAKSNLIFLNYLINNKAVKITKSNKIIIDFDIIKTTIETLTSEIIIMQGNGDYQGAKNFIQQNSTISTELQNILDVINEKNIPKDIVFEQGIKYLNL